MSKLSVVIDCFPESVQHYGNGYAVVAIDVIRATTTAITAVSCGRRCFFAPSIEGAIYLAARLDKPLLVGELGGNMPYGFNLNNSPKEVAQRTDITRPMVLVSTSGSQLLYNLKECDIGYVACFRNYSAIANHLINRHCHIALIGAGARGEFREEDQMCCSWIADSLIKAGYKQENDRTAEIVNQWRNAPARACANGNSAEYLRNSGQLEDLEFILTHVNDIDLAFMVKDDEIIRVPGQKPDKHDNPKRT